MSVSVVDLRRQLSLGSTVGCWLLSICLTMSLDLHHWFA